MDNVIVWKNRTTPVLVIDDYLSLLWTTRYNEAGDFQMELPIEYSENKYIIEGSFLTIADDNGAMIIEDINPVEQDDGIEKLIISGPSTESVLKWRTTLVEVYLTGEIRTNIAKLIDDNIISPSNPARTLPGFSQNTLSSPVTTSFDNIYEVSVLYDIIVDICKTHKLGFRVIFDEEGGLMFELYQGVDRTSPGVPYVIFSEEFDNVYSSSYYISTKGFKNVAMVISDDPLPAAQLVPAYVAPEPVGYDRREKVTDAKDTERVVDGQTLTDSQFIQVLTEKGLSDLDSLRPMGIFEGSVDITGAFVYGVDFDMGDIVRCVFVNRDTNGRVVELIRSRNSEGDKRYISFDFDVL